MAGIVAAGYAKIPFQMDSWDGYQEDRNGVFDAACRLNDGECLGNFVSLAGDTHNFFAGHLRTRDNVIVGHEIGCQSVTAPGFELVRNQRFFSHQNIS